MNKPKVGIEFNDTIYDFGYINDFDSIHKCRFIFRNTSKTPVTVLSVISSCDCTKASFTNRIIHPGDTGHICVSHKTYAGFIGEFKESLIVRISSEKKYRLEIFGDIEPIADLNDINDEDM